MGTNKAFPLEGKVGPKDPDEGEPAAAPPGADAAATGEWPRSKNASERCRAVAFFGHRNRGEVPEPFRTASP